jgi:3'-phosphoadenosine 5'-phosphosulfate sulfotransferase (PAPS reductase)/FAD synthetase
MTRIIVWFSAGAASAVAAKLTLIEHPEGWPGPRPIEIIYVDPGSEHPDNPRFIADVAAWLDYPVTTIRSDRYRDTWQVWEERRFLVGPTGALCTAELKKRPRYAFQRPDDTQVFGYTAEETHRAERFRNENPGVDLACPLIDRGLTKNDCLAIVERAGLALPVMYRLGFRNNNCVGCPKGGMGYWNMIRKHFPDTFNRMAILERDIGHSVLSDASGPVWLNELDPDRGDIHTEPAGDCSLLCVLAEDEIS